LAKVLASVRVLVSVLAMVSVLVRVIAFALAKAMEVVIAIALAMVTAARLSVPRWALSQRLYWILPWVQESDDDLESNPAPTSRQLSLP
jgi:hypothetical protein